MLLTGIQFYLLLTVSADSINLFQKGTSTKKPDVPYEDSPVSKPRKPPVHISEFTDPDTGLNPFLDIEEGPTSAGRNVMKDEHNKDLPFLDFELVEGDGADRQWGLDSPNQPLEEPVQRWPPFENNESTTAIQHTPQTIVTNTEIYEDTSVKEEGLHIKGHKIENEDRTVTFSNDLVIYASVTIATLVALVLVAGVCWWKRKVKRTTQSHIPVASGDFES